MLQLDEITWLFSHRSSQKLQLLCLIVIVTFRKDIMELGYRVFAEESIPFSPIHLTGRLKESGFTIPDFEESTQH